MSATEKWEYVHGESEKWDASRVVIDGPGFSAPYTIQHGSGRDQKQDAHNRLIASAPELLEACKDAVSRCVCGGSGTWDATNTKCFACDKMRAAIKKASGT